MSPMHSNLSPEQEREVGRQHETIRRGAVEIVPEEQLIGKLRRSVSTGVPLRLKLGMDPSSPDIHLGHTVVLQKIRQMQDFGHICDLVIGDFTGQIGDPTGKSETRNQLTEQQVNENAQTYVQQVFKVLDPKRTTIVRNADWLSKLNFSEVIGLASTITVARMLEREDFSKRYKDNRPIHIHEFFYPLMQAYDSVHLHTDIEFGGTDQKFNLLMGRTLQKDLGQDQQITVMMPLLEGLDGVQKMSKSLGNYIGIDESPHDMFGKVMSIPDHIMPKYIELLLSVSVSDLQKIVNGLQTGQIHPRDVKMQLARDLVSRFLGAVAAHDAEEQWVTVFQQGGVPDDIPTVQMEAGTYWIVQVLVDFGLASSNSEARRFIQQGGVKVDGSKIDDPSAHIVLQEGTLLQVGRRRFARCKG
jgi:tyrosyl-tRNA synthetase